MPKSKLQWENLFFGNSEMFYMNTQRRLGDVKTDDDFKEFVRKSVSVWDGDEPVETNQTYFAESGEEPDWDTPKKPVNWTGFKAAVH